MEKIAEFAGNHYILFMTITILLIFALIGYIVDTKRSKSDLVQKSEDELNEEMLDNLILPDGKSLAETVNVSKNVDPETKTVILNDPNILGENELSSNASDNQTQINNQ